MLHPRWRRAELSLNAASQRELAIIILVHRYCSKKAFLRTGFPHADVPLFLRQSPLNTLCNLEVHCEFLVTERAIEKTERYFPL
jgi:hypothetical protein